MKICAKCKVEKPTTEFSKRPASSDGFRSYCKACDADYHAANRQKISERNARWRAENRESILAKKAEYRAANKAKISESESRHYQKNRAAINARQAIYSLVNRDARLEAGAAYRERNREILRAKQTQYAIKNPEKCAELARNRRARKRNAEGRHTAVDVLRIFEHQRGLCANCHSRLFKSGKQKFHVDHINPLARGGSNWPSSLQCLCPSCNMAKKAKDPFQWANENGRLI